MAQVTEWQRMIVAGLTGSDLSGVGSDYLGELAVTGTVSPVAVATGGAVAYGFIYLNSASVNVAIPTPSVSTRIDRIVLRVDWTAQTVRITRVAGTEGGAAPALTQTAGTTWDMALAQVSITTGGVITVTDQREWLTTVGDLSVDSTKLASNAVTTAKITDANVTLAKMAANSVGTSQIIDANVTTAKILDANVTLAKIQNIATDSLVGRDTAGTGVPENITLGASLSMTGAQVLQRAALTGDVTASANSNATAIAANAVTTAKILDANVTAAKIAAGVIPPSAFAVYDGSNTGVTTDTVLTLALTHELDPDSIFSISSNIVTIATAGWYFVSFFVNLSPTSSAGDWDFLAYINSSATANLSLLSLQIYANGTASTAIGSSLSMGQIVHIAAATQVRFRAARSSGAVTCDTDHQISFRLLEVG